MKNNQEVSRYEGSHVYIFDSIKNPRKIVLATNSYIGHIATPGWGKRGDMGFEEAAKRYTEKQTGLIIDDLELLSEWDNNGKPFREPNGVLQFVKVRNYLARRTDPTDIEKRIEEYRQTENGMKYKPELVEIAKLPEIDNLAQDVIEGLEKHLGYKF